MQNYDAILSDAPDETEQVVLYLSDVLPDMWVDEYLEMTPFDTEIVTFTLDHFTFLFDLSVEVFDTQIDDMRAPVEARVVAVYGRSHPGSHERDRSRMQGFLGPTQKVFGKGYDKGHFIGHSLGGGLDVNLFPQRRDINRGWSARGKIYRAMENYCAEHPGTFCFSRPIYCDTTWKPCELEYGLVIPAGAFWVERFDN